MMLFALVTATIVIARMYKESTTKAGFFSDASS